MVPRPHDVRYLPLPWDLSSFQIFARYELAISLGTFPRERDEHQKATRGHR
jgi:hypothetical protein